MYILWIWWLSGKESACQCRRCRFDPWIGRIPWRKKWQPTPVFLPGKSQGQRRLAGYSPWGLKRVRHNWATKQQPLGLGLPLSSKPQFPLLHLPSYSQEMIYFLKVKFPWNVLPDLLLTYHVYFYSYSFSLPVNLKWIGTSSLFLLQKHLCF